MLGQLQDMFQVVCGWNPLLSLGLGGCCAAPCLWNNLRLLDLKRCTWRALVTDIWRGKLFFWCSWLVMEKHILNTRICASHLLMSPVSLTGMNESRTDIGCCGCIFHRQGLKHSLETNRKSTFPGGFWITKPKKNRGCFFLLEIHPKRARSFTTGLPSRLVKKDLWKIWNDP